MAKAKPTAAAAPADEPAYAGTDMGPGAGDSGKAVVTHVLGVLTFFLGPLVLYLVLKGKASPWLRAHLAGSTNDGILTFGLVVVLVVLLAFLPAAVTVLALLLLLVLLLHVAGRALALVQSVRGRPFHIPLTPRLVH